MRRALIIALVLAGCGSRGPVGPGEPTTIRLGPGRPIIETLTVSASEHLAARMPLPAYPGLPGRVIGLLYRGDAPWGIDPGWQRKVLDVNQRWREAGYRFTSGENLPWYARFRVEPTLSRAAYLVEIEIADGAGARRGAPDYQITGMERRDETRDFPLDVEETLSGARVRFDEWLDEKALELGQPEGLEKETIQEAAVPAWLPESSHLRVLFYRRILRTTSRQDREPPRRCRRGAPCPGPKILYITEGYGLELALELEYDRNGDLIAERRIEPARMLESELEKLHITAP